MQTKRHNFRMVRGPRGAVLITAMWSSIALAAVVLVLCREMIVESMASQQHLSQAKVDAAEIGVEQYVLSVVEQELVTPGYHDQVRWEQRQIGGTPGDPQSGCYFWVLGMNVDDETRPYYNLVDEASKIDLNTATAEMMDYLPGMDNDSNLSQAIVDWRDSDDDDSYSSLSSGQGSETSYYEGLNPPYRAKNQPFESVEELRLVNGFTDEYLWGADLNHNNTIEPNEAASANLGMAFGNTMRGLASYVTVYGVRATNPPASYLAQVIGSGVPQQITDPTTGQAVDVIDINDPNTLTTANANGTSLQTLLQQYAPAQAAAIVTATTARVAPPAQRGQTATPQPFKSVAEWMAVVAQSGQITSADLYPVYPYLVCNDPGVLAQLNGTATSTSGTVTNGTVSSTTNVMTIEGVMTIESIGTDANGDNTATYSPAAKVNINTATKPVLMALPGFEEADADAIISYRESEIAGQNAADIPNITWLLDCQIDPAKLVQAAPYITGTSTVFSADIVTVSRDGRAFKRVKIVVDASTGTPQILYRRDLTDDGWPMDPAIRTALRNGQDPSTVSGGSVFGR